MKKSASKILYDRYIKGDPGREAAAEQERINCAVAARIYQARKEAGLTQKALAELVGTQQSVISRLEDADYEGHSLAMLYRIADALNLNVEISFTPKASAAAH